MIALLALLACAPDPPDEELCDDGGFVSGGGGDLDLVQDGVARSSCGAIAEIGGTATERAVRVLAGAQTEDDPPIGWSVEIVVVWPTGEDPPASCDEASADVECLIELRSTERASPTCIWMAHTEQDEPALGLLEVGLQEVGEEEVVGTFSGTLQASDALCPEEPPAVVTGGTFRALVPQAP